MQIAQDSQQITQQMVARKAEIKRDFQIVYNIHSRRVSRLLFLSELI